MKLTHFSLQIHLQRLALAAGHTAFKERLHELQTLKLHLKNATREVSVYLVMASTRYCIAYC